MSNELTALTFRAPGTMRGRPGTVYIAIDEIGPRMTFEFSGGSTVGFTSDDADFAHDDIFIAKDLDLAAEWRDACESEFLFESGVGDSFEGDYTRRTFRSYSSAVAFAKEKSDEYVTPFVRAVRLYD